MLKKKKKHANDKHNVPASWKTLFSLSDVHFSQTQCPNRASELTLGILKCPNIGQRWDIAKKNPVDPISEVLSWLIVNIVFMHYIYSIF